MLWSWGSSWFCAVVPTPSASLDYLGNHIEPTRRAVHGWPTRWQYLIAEEDGSGQ